MKQVAQNYRSGELIVVDSPPPRCSPGGVLVHTLYSLISTGTELMKVSESKMSLLGKAKARPEQVRKVLDTVAQQGPAAAYKKAMNRLDSYSPLGYSLAGIVCEVGPGAEEFRVGQAVACAGNEFALHAEVNWVPSNLCVPLPPEVAPQSGAFATLGAIAMQGVRQGQVQLGDTACVIGLGLVGQLVVQLLVASGVRVVGIDPVPDRCRLAEKAGAVLCAAPDEQGLADLERVLAQVSGGLGADRVFLVAGGTSKAPVEVAARLARDRAVVVDIGKCKLDLPWNAYYEKELELRFSRSYGPGRYDHQYEVEGVDYPPGYVRWTERRNLSCFLDLLATGDIDVEPLISDVFPIDDAPDVYERLRTGTLEGVGFLFEYPAFDPGSVNSERSTITSGGPAASLPRSKDRIPGRGGTLRVGFVGAGNYASTMLLPHLTRLDHVQLVSVSTNRSLSAMNAQRKFGFERADTDSDSVIYDESLDAVFVVTRHSSHADLVCRALEAGQQVFVEKPLALSLEELDRIMDTVATTGNDRIMVGFNRRFAPMLRQLKNHFAQTSSPTVARYLVNAGQLPPDSWYKNEDLEGTRFAGEGGHFIDTLSWWIGSDPVDVTAFSTPGADMSVVLRYADGSLGTVEYITCGHPRYPKETFEAASGVRHARMENFRRTSVWYGRGRKRSRVLSSADKGQQAEIYSFLNAVRDHEPMPISLASLATTTRATLAAVASAATRSSVKM